ncbi:hypothetical protein [Nonomuraea cavernae]|nr:hypothetical protein [Nonomuraea cavernae]MCA2187283.1 hypothetical protein [Nonomuraea cavernae]
MSEDESVQVTIGSNGLVERIQMDPRVMRGGPEEVAGLARDAMRNAQQDWFRQLAQAKSAHASEARKVEKRL